MLCVSFMARRSAGAVLAAAVFAAGAVAVQPEPAHGKGLGKVKPATSLRLTDGTCRFCALVKPDLAISADRGTVTVKNQGFADAGAFVVTVYQGLAGPRDYQVGSLARGATVTIRDGAVNPYDSNACLIAAVDSGHGVDELDENNNRVHGLCLH